MGKRGEFIFKVVIIENDVVICIKVQPNEAVYDDLIGIDLSRVRERGGERAYEISDRRIYKGKISEPELIP